MAKAGGKAASPGEGTRTGNAPPPAKPSNPAFRAAQANMEPARNCPICQADASAAPVAHVRQRDNLCRCPRCRSLFANPRYAREELADLYRREYYGTAGSGTDRARKQAQAEVLHRTVLKVLMRRYPGVVRSGAKLLDFGCGLGYFLDEARRTGLRGVGVELSEEAAEFARAKLGLEVITGDETALGAQADAQFDLVTAWEVIEHVLEPRETLRLLVDKLAPGGVLGLSFPNVGCWRFRIEGGRWFNAANPTHLNLPTWPAIRDLLRELHLADVRRAVFWGGRPGFGPLANLAQYVARLLKVGSDVRVFARKPGA